MPDEAALRNPGRGLGWRVRAMVAGRVVLATFGGYAIAALSTAFLSLALPMVRSEAVATATLLSFAVMVGAVVWVFSARTLGRAALGLAVPGILLGGGLWLALTFVETVSPA